MQLVQGVDQRLRNGKEASGFAKDISLRRLLGFHIPHITLIPRITRVPHITQIPHLLHLSRIFSSFSKRNSRKNESEKEEMAISANPKGGPFDGLWRPERLEKFWGLQIPNRITLEAHGWNPDGCSENILIGFDHLTFSTIPLRPGVCDNARGKVGFTKGFQVWGLVWVADRTCNELFIGVGTKNTPLRGSRLKSIIGFDDESYGWDILHGRCYHGSRKNSWQYPNDSNGRLREYVRQSFRGNGPFRIMCILDMDNGYLAFWCCDEYCGVAFTGLKGKTLYPMVSTVFSECTIKMVYLGSLPPEPRSLRDICQGEVRKLLEGSGVSRLQASMVSKDVCKCLLPK